MPLPYVPEAGTTQTIGLEIRRLLSLENAEATVPQPTNFASTPLRTMRSKRSGRIGNTVDSHVRPSDMRGGRSNTSNGVCNAIQRCAATSIGEPTAVTDMSASVMSDDRGSKPSNILITSSRS